MLREPPHNIEAEQALLGAILVNNQAIHRVADFLEADHFYDPLHGRIYEAAHRLITKGRRATPVTLKTDFEDEQDIGELTAAQYLGRLSHAAVAVAGVEDFARTVYDLARRRRLVEIGETMIAQAIDAPIDAVPETLIETSEASLAALAERGLAQNNQLFSSEVAEQAINLVAAAYQRDGGMAGLSTGLLDLDDMLGGMGPSDLIIAAGRPSMGKTSLAVGIAYHNAKLYLETKDNEKTGGTVEGCPVGFFSLEMSAVQIMLKMIAGETGLPVSDQNRGNFSANDFNRIVDACRATLGRISVIWDQSGGITVAQLAARARRMKRKQKVGLIVIDYLQLIRGSKDYRGNRASEVTDITTTLKALAKELEVPILALSQLSREVERREDKRPHLADLRESGSIEQDADVVMFVFREEYYAKRREPKKNTAQHVEWENEMDGVKGKAELVIAKQRQGPTGTVEVQFTEPTAKFSNLAKQERFSEVAA